jgi:hypothetical protein
MTEDHETVDVEGEIIIIGRGDIEVRSNEHRISYRRTVSVAIAPTGIITERNTAVDNRGLRTYR